MIFNIIFFQLAHVLAQAQQCIFFKPDGTRSVREAKQPKNCMPSNSSDLSHNECCTAHPAGPSCAFEQRTADSLPEWYEDSSSKTASTSICFITGGPSQCLYILKDGSTAIAFWTTTPIITGGLSYEWVAKCATYPTADGNEYYNQCEPKRYGNGPEPPRISQIPKKVEFRGPGSDIVYTRTLYCYQE